MIKNNSNTFSSDEALCTVLFCYTTIFQSYYSPLTFLCKFFAHMSTSSYFKLVFGNVKNYIRMISFMISNADFQASFFLFIAIYVLRIIT